MLLLLFITRITILLGNNKTFNLFSNITAQEIQHWYRYGRTVSNMSFVRAVRLRVPAGSAKPGPAIGQALGPLGINMAQFCKEFNEKSETLYEKDTPLRVELRARSDRTYTFSVRSPPTAWLVKQAAGVTKGPTSPNVAGAEPSGHITPEAVYHIAAMKQADDNRWHLPLEGIAKSVVGTARSIGIVVREETDAQQDEEKAASA